MRLRVLSRLNALLRRAGWKIVPHPQELNPGSGRSFEVGARHAISAKILECISAGSEFRFLQIGAHEGSGPAEPSLLSSCCRRRGVLVEPQPAMAEKLRQRFHNDPGIRVIQCAVGQSPCSLPFFAVHDPEGSLPAWTSQIASFDRAHVEKFSREVPGLERRIRELAVEVDSPESICQRMSIDYLDLLMIDVEGWDWEVIRAFPFERIPVDLVIFEHGHLRRADRRAAVRRLVGLGFQVQLLSGDGVATRATPQ